MFDDYRGSGDANPTKTIMSNKLNKLWKETQIYDRRLRPEHIDIIYLHAVSDRPLDGWYKSRDEASATLTTLTALARMSTLSLAPVGGPHEKAGKESASPQKG